MNTIIKELPLMIFARLLRIWVKFRYKSKSKNAVFFMPHEGMLFNDMYDLFNFRSDNALSFAHYLLENKLLEESPFIFLVPNYESLNRLIHLTKQKYPQKEFRFVLPVSVAKEQHCKTMLNMMVSFVRQICASKYIFTSCTYNLKPYVSNQIVVDLNYFTVPFKNDIYTPSHPLYMELDRRGHEYYGYVCTSELSIRVIMPTMTLPYSKFYLLGMCRNDYMTSKSDFKFIRNIIISQIDYLVKKIVLYTPTHRDYEKKEKDLSRFLLGFSADLKDLDSFLRREGILILCKLHPKQNKEIIDMSLPSSIMIHKPNHEYGLTELMQISDGLITDYTSGYFDYLLLDKPIIFNFYDVDIYKSTRGFTYNPIESITAGEIVKDVDSFKRALLLLDDNAESFKEKRRFVRDLFFTYQDDKNCERVYNCFCRRKNS